MFSEKEINAKFKEKSGNSLAVRYLKKNSIPKYYNPDVKKLSFPESNWVRN